MGPTNTMPASILDQVTLGYQLVWNRLRQRCAVQLFVRPQSVPSVDIPHLLSAVDALWSEQAPGLLLSPQSPQLLNDLLDQAPAGSVHIEVNQAWLHSPATAQRVHHAHQRGLQLVWRGEPGQRPNVAMSPCFVRTMVNLTAEEALTGLRVSLRKHQLAHQEAPGNGSGARSPVLAGQIYESVASRVLVEHCLDQQAAWGVAGWPTEDVLHGYRHQRLQPGQQAIIHLVEAIDADESTEQIEQALAEEPLLAYRFLRYANSAGLGLRTEIESLRHGLMVLGHALVKSWLLEQLPQASGDLNLQPIRSAMTLRAQLMAQLLDAGEGDELRRELYLCGLLSQIDLILGEPLPAALQRLPLSGRVNQALLSQSGPYAPYLAVATALESSDTPAVQALCEAHGLASGEVNRVLLRTLGAAPLHAPRGLLLV
jgi:hypothetical protein